MVSASFDNQDLQSLRSGPPPREEQKEPESRVVATEAQAPEVDVEFNLLRIAHG